MLDGVTMDAYGSQMPLTNSPMSARRTATHYRASLEHQLDRRRREGPRSADLGLNPMNDGTLIRVPVPALTEDHRKEMVKRLHKVLEEQAPHTNIVAMGTTSSKRR